MPLCFFALSSVAKTTKTCARGAFVMNVLDPFRMYLSPFRTARRRQRGGVRAAARFGQPHAADPLAGGELRQILLFLRLRSVLHDVGGAQIGVGAPGQGVAAVHAGVADRLAGEAAGDDIRPLSAVLLRNGQAQQSHLAEFPPDLEAEFALQIGLFAERARSPPLRTGTRFPGTCVCSSLIEKSMVFSFTILSGSP